MCGVELPGREGFGGCSFAGLAAHGNRRWTTTIAILRDLTPVASSSAIYEGVLTSGRMPLLRSSSTPTHSAFGYRCDYLMTMRITIPRQVVSINTARGERRMNEQVNRKSTITPHKHRSRAHEFVTASIMAADGFYQQQEAVPLSDLRSAIEGSGNTIGFSDYVAYEAMLRDDHAKHLAELDSQEFADDSAGNDYEGTAEYKKGHAEFLLHRDLNQTLYWCRERLMETAQAV
jgi:hypothetical protein